MTEPAHFYSHHYKLCTNTLVGRVIFTWLDLHTHAHAHTHTHTHTHTQINILVTQEKVMSESIM